MAVKSNKLERGLSELTNKKFRRSIYFVKGLKKRQKVSNKDIKRIRPGYGLEPKHFDTVIGKVLKYDVERGDPVLLDALSN